MLSVVIPNYNHGRFLKRAVVSHLEGARTPVEFVIVDDCSTDDSVAIIRALCREYPEVKMIRREERGGPNRAINTGLAEATGDYVRFAGADDFVSPGAGDNAIATLQEHPGAAFCFSDPSQFDVRTGRYQGIPLALADGPAFYPPAAFAALLAGNYFTISSNTVVYRRDAIGTLGGFPPDFEWQADWFANLVLAFRYGICYRPESLFHFSVEPDSYGNAGVKSGEGQRRLLFHFLDALDGQYADIRDHFRAAALLPEMRLRDLGWLVSDPRGRRYVTPKMALRLIAREGWTHLRPFLPAGSRRWLRRRAAA